MLRAKAWNSDYLLLPREFYLYHISSLCLWNNSWSSLDSSFLLFLPYRCTYISRLANQLLFIKSSHKVEIERFGPIRLIRPLEASYEFGVHQAEPVDSLVKTVQERKTSTTTHGAFYFPVAYCHNAFKFFSRVVHFESLLWGTRLVGNLGIP